MLKLAERYVRRASCIAAQLFGVFFGFDAVIGSGDRSSVAAYVALAMAGWASWKVGVLFDFMEETYGETNDFIDDRDSGNGEDVLPVRPVHRG